MLVGPSEIGYAETAFSNSRPTDYKSCFNADRLNLVQKNIIQPIYFNAFKMKKGALRVCVLDAMKESYPEFTKNPPLD